MKKTNSFTNSFLEFFRINRLFTYVVLAMVMPSIAFPATVAMDSGIDYAPRSSVSTGAWWTRGLAKLIGGQPPLTAEPPAAAAGSTRSMNNPMLALPPATHLPAHHLPGHRPSTIKAFLPADVLGSGMPSGVSSGSVLAVRREEGKRSTYAPRGSGNRVIRAAAGGSHESSDSSEGSAGSSSGGSSGGGHSDDSGNKSSVTLGSTPVYGAAAPGPAEFTGLVELGGGTGLPPAGDYVAVAVAAVAAGARGKGDGIELTATGVSRSAAAGSSAAGDAVIIGVSNAMRTPGCTSAVAAGGGDRGGDDDSASTPSRAAGGAGTPAEAQLSPGLKKVSAFMEELFSQKATRMQKIRNFVTFLAVGGLAISLWGMVQYFQDNLTAVPNSNISQYFQNEGGEYADKMVNASMADLMLLIPYYVYRMKLVVDYIFGQVTMAPMSTQDPSLLLRGELGLVYLLTILASALQGVGSSNDTYQANEPFVNTQDYARIAPIPFGIFTALNFFMVLVNPVEEKAISFFIKRASGKENTVKRTALVENIGQAMGKIYRMEEGAVRKLWGRLQPEGRDLKGIQQLKAVFGIVEPTVARVPAINPLRSATSRILAKVASKRYVPATLAGTNIPMATTLGRGGVDGSSVASASASSTLRASDMDTSISHGAGGDVSPAPRKGFKAVLKRGGIALFWAIAAAVSLGSAYLAFNKSHQGILDLDRRIKTGKPDLTFYDQTVDEKARRFEADSLSGLTPELQDASMAGWDLYNGESNYTGIFPDGRPYTDNTINATDACSKCLSGADYKTSPDDISSDDPLGYYLTFRGDCPWAPPAMAKLQLYYTFNPTTDIVYGPDVCNAFYGYIRNQLQDITSYLTPLPGHVLPQSRYFYEQFVRGAGALDLIIPNNSTYVPTEDVERIGLTMGGFGGLVAFAIGVFSFKQFFRHMHDSFSRNPVMAMPGKNNRLFNAIEMPIAGMQSLFYSMQNVFLVWGALSGQDDTMKILAATAATTTAVTVWFRTFDEAYVAIAGWMQQGLRNMKGKYHKWRDSGIARPPLPVNVIKERMIRKLMVLQAALLKMDPKILEEVYTLVTPSKPKEIVPVR